MKALILEKYKNLVYKDVPDPLCGDDDVIVRVMACGICGSDVHGYDGSTGRRIPPIIMGHEASGIIESTGKNVKNWNVGDEVTFDSTVYPLNDWYTLEGHYNLSDNREVLGVSPGTYRRNGAFAEFVAIPQHILYPIPEGVSFSQAAMTEAAAVALHAINIAGIKTGDNCAVTGTGMIGTFIIKLLEISGTSEIIAIDIDPLKLENAKKAGATKTFISNDPAIFSDIAAVTRGRGTDVSFEASGNSAAVNVAIEAARKGGKVILVGNTSPVVDFPLQKVVTRELKVLGSCAIRGEYEVVLDLLAKGRLSVDDQISAVVPMSEGPKWFERLYNKEKGLLKVILVP
jgi:L-iditol 2-dehydrogenase